MPDFVLMDEGGRGFHQTTALRLSNVRKALGQQWV